MIAARTAAIAACGTRWAHWIEDVAQEVALAVVLQARRGQRIGRRGYWYYAMNAVRTIRGAPSRQGRTVEITPELERSEAMACRPPSPLAMLAVWRLQREWDGLCTTQRGALALVLEGVYGDSVDVRRRIGCSQQALHSARGAGLAKLDRRPRGRRRARMRDTRLQVGKVYENGRGQQRLLVAIMEQSSPVRWEAIRPCRKNPWTGTYQGAMDTAGWLAWLAKGTRTKPWRIVEEDQP